jgi:uncharacterized protein YecA (UPF0149 family)
MNDKSLSSSTTHSFGSSTTQRSTRPGECRIDNTPKAGPVIPRKYIGRNAKCPCGSDKKYKKCCLLEKNFFSIIKNKRNT